MENLKKLWWLYLSSLMLVISFGIKVLDRRVHLVFCDVGQGDGILIYQGSVEVVIDAGAREEGILKCLSKHMPFWDRRIEMVVSTHPDKDHIGGMMGVFDSYDVASVVISEIEGNNDELKKVRKVIDEQQIRVIKPMGNELLRGGSLEFEVFWPRLEGEGLKGAVSGEQTNNWSVVMMFKYGKFEALLTADASMEIEGQLEGLSEVEVLKIGHHGSKYSSGEKFLKALSPKLAVIQVGKNNYGHPAGEVLSRLENMGVKVLRNDTSGEIEIVTDGEVYKQLVEH